MCITAVVVVVVVVTVVVIFLVGSLVLVRIALVACLVAVVFRHVHHQCHIVFETFATFCASTWCGLREGIGG